MQVEFSGDELILVLVSLIRATNPAMLRQGPEGFTVDFDSLEGKLVLDDDERLLLRLRAALESPAGGLHSLDLTAAERSRLVETLVRLEALQPWPPDVQEMNRNLCARLTAAE